ncbi:autotransporter-associated beta strand repeat-containing protein [Luteolibacter sp. LG18]|uniref:beta strand repeat-containing protein n=1 Tax=Luteolibacter sp. LG18 TaxID=2819286 RepID=UPI002B2DB9BF|nr:hypothetical protein llg_25740 [Luteolibacter sp. LG18]
MKLKRFLPALLGSTVVLSPLAASAASQYFDTTNASGLTAGTATWDTGVTAAWANSAAPGTASPVVWIAGSDAFFQTGGTNTVTVSGTVDANSLTQTVNGTATTIGGGTLQIGAGGVANTGNQTLVLNSAITLTAGQAWNAASAITVGGAIGGTGFGITKNGTGALTFSAGNGYTGATSVANGNLTLAAAGGTIANSDLTIGTGTGTGNNVSFTIAAPTAAGSVQRTKSLSWNGGVLGGNNGSAFVVNGSSAGNTIENFGVLTLSSGVLRGSVAANAASNTRLVFDSASRSAGTTLYLGRSTTAIGGSTIASQTANTANVVFTTAPALSGNGGTGTSVSIVPWADVGTVLATYDATNGLRALNTSTEMATLASGMSLGTGTAGQNAKVSANTSLAADTTVNSLYGTGGTVSFGSDATRLNVSSGAILASVGFTIGSGTAGGNGIVDFKTAEGHIFVENTRTLTVNSAIAGSGGLTVYLDNFNASSANLVLAGANTYTGVTTFSGNNAALTVRLTHSLALQNTTLDYNNYGASLSFGNGGTTGQTAYTFGGLKGAQGITLANNNTTAAAVALTVGGNGDTTTYSGNLQNGSGGAAGGSLVKTGTGTLTLSGTNTYSGGTTVSAGGLRAANVSAVGTGPVLVNGGSLTTAVANLGTGALTLQSGSISANDAATGTFTLGVNQAFTMSGGTLALSFASASSYDQILGSGTGTFSLTGGNLDLTNSVTDYTASYQVLSGFASGSSSGISIINYNTANYLANLSNSGLLTFTAVPEPGTCLLGGLATLLLLRRRRQ